MGNVFLFWLIAEVPEKPVGPLLIDNITQNSVDLSWQPPKSDGGAPVKSYLIEYKPLDGRTWLKAGSTTGLVTDFTVPNLNEGTDYLFRVSAINEEGQGKPLESDTAVKPKKGISMYQFNN